MQISVWLAYPCVRVMYRSFSNERMSCVWRQLFVYFKMKYMMNILYMWNTFYPFDATNTFFGYISSFVFCWIKGIFISIPGCQGTSVCHAIIHWPEDWFTVIAADLCTCTCLFSPFLQFSYWAVSAITDKKAESVDATYFLSFFCVPPEG